MHFFAGIFHNLDLIVLLFNLDLDLISDLLKNKDLSEPSRYEFSIAAFRVFIRPFVFELAGGIILAPFIPSAARSAGDLSAAQVNMKYAWYFFRRPIFARQCRCVFSGIC